MKLTAVAFLAVILMRDEMTAVFIVLFHLMAPIHVFHILFVLNFLFVNNMMVIILMQGYIHLTLSQIQAERKAGSTCLCAYHSQYHYRQSGHFNELLFHNRVFSICLLLRASVWPSVYRDTGKSNSVQ